MVKKKVSAAPAPKASGRATAIAKQEKQVRAYVADQAHERVLHVEKAGSELVGPTRYDIWDVHCAASRWWVVTNPLNLYSQQDFKSRDVALTFHIGLMLRVLHMQEREVPVRPEKADLLPGSWRRWQQAFDAYDSGDEAETFQSVGVRLRECLVSFVGETCTPQLVPAGEAPPKRSDFKAWTELLANHLAPGDGSAKLRSYLKKVAIESWEYVNWLTHAKNAIRLDAEIGLKMIEHLLGTFSAARLRSSWIEMRCAACQSYRVVAGTCQECNWSDAGYATSERFEWTAEERARRLAEPCTPSSDISTFTSASDLLRR